MRTKFLHISKRRFFFPFLMFVLLLLGIHGVTRGQTTGDYRSTTTGNWTTLATWQYFNGTSWATPTGTSPQGYPGQFAGTNNVLIQSGHVVTIGASGITTQPFASLNIASTAQLYLTGANQQVTFTINTSVIDIQSGGSIYFFNKVKLELSVNAVLSLFVGQGGLLGDCNANVEIWIGTFKFAACAGTPGNIFTFVELMASGGTLNAIPTSNSPLCQGNTINLTGSYTGAIGTAPSYSWDVTPPGASLTTYSTQNVTITNAIAGTYTAKLTVTTVLSGSTYTNTETISVVVNPLPTVNAGGAVAAICQSGTTGSLGGSFGGGATAAVWSDGGAGGSFANNGGSTPNTAIYTASATSTSPVTLTLTTSGGSCGTTFASKQLTVNPLPIPGIAGQNLVSTNETGVVYTTQSGMTSYSWAITGGSVTAGGGSTNNTVTVSWGSAGTGHVKVNYINGNGCTASAQTDYPVTILVKESAANASWNHAGTWYPSGVPTSVQDIIVNDAVIVDNTPLAVCNNMTINTGGVVQIDPGKSLTVSGALVNNAGESGLVIKSDASGTGSLISATTGVDAKVQRFLTKMKWHFIGMPVESGVAGVFHLPAGHADIYLKTHIEASNTWGPFIVPVETPLTQGRGYECWVGDPTVPANQMDETVVFPGKLGAGNYTTGSGSFYALEYTSGHGLNLICNPYPSALQANIHTWTNTNIAPKVYIWDPTYGNYRYWNGISGTPAPYAGYGTLAGGVIPEMQSFFIEATGASPSLTIPQSDRIHSSQAYYKDSGIPLNTLRLDVAGNGFEDAMFINFNEFSTEGYDSDFDVEKLYGLNEAPQLYSIIAGKNLSINALPELYENLIIPVGFECEATSTFTIQASGLDGFDENIEFYLEDLTTGTFQSLNENPVYAFTGGGGEDPLRFRLHFGNITAAEEFVSNSIRIYSNENMVYIRDLKPGNVSVNIYDMMGRQIEEMQTTSAGEIRMQVISEAGFYIVKVQTGDQFYTEKVFIK